MAFHLESKGDFRNLERFLKTMDEGGIFKNLRKYAEQGAAALASLTPKDSGFTAGVWSYEIDMSDGCTITWTNDHQINGVPLVIMLQYGHGTGTGGWVTGRDFINPAIQPVMDQIARDVWEAVKSA